MRRINDAATLVWNGPLGAFEIAPFDQGTVAAARHAARAHEGRQAVSVAGGGDTVSALNHAGVADDFSYVSTAGGAFLEWLEGKPLPGVDALKNLRRHEASRNWIKSQADSDGGRHGTHHLETASRITPPSTATACRPSTSTTWSRRSPSWRRPNAVDAPVIIQASRGARSYANDIMLKHMMDARRRRSIRTSRSACISTTATTPPPA